jgi:hypothetical protein
MTSIILEQSRQQAMKGHEEILRSEQKTIIATAEQDLRRRLKDLEDSRENPIDPPHVLLGFFKKALEKVEANEQLLFNMHEVKRYNIDESVIDKISQTARVMIDLKTKYIKMKHAQAMISVDEEIAFLKADLEREGEESWQFEQKQVTDGWKDEGSLRLGFLKEQEKSVKYEEDLILSYIRDQVWVNVC